jgi:hypothetical protein
MPPVCVFHSYPHRILAAIVFLMATGSHFVELKRFFGAYDNHKLPPTRLFRERALTPAD